MKTDVKTPITLATPPVIIKIGDEIAIATSGLKDFFPIKYFASKTLKAAARKDAINVHATYKIKPGEVWRPSSKNKNKTPEMPTLIAAVIKKFRICIVKNLRKHLLVSFAPYRLDLRELHVFLNVFFAAHSDQSRRNSGR